MHRLPAKTKNVFAVLTTTCESGNPIRYNPRGITLSENLLVERCIEQVLGLRLKHENHLKNVIFVFPRMKFESEAEWSNYPQMSLLGAIQNFSPSSLAAHALFIPIDGITEVEVIVFRSDAKRLAQYGILSIRRRKKGFGIHILSEMIAWFVPSITEEKDMSILGDQIEAASSATVPWFVSRGNPGKSPLLGILENESYSSQQARKDIRRILWLEQGKKCSDCGNYISSLSDATLDHSVPQVAHGTDTKDNLSVMCKRCNHEKGHRLPPRLSPYDTRLDAYSERNGLWLPPTE